MKDLIIYHGNCPDGWGSAWWLSKAIEGEGREVELFPGKYGKPAPEVNDEQNVWIVDFCYPGDELEKLAATAGRLIILDHHQTAIGYLADAPSVHVFNSFGEYTLTSSAHHSFAILDMDRSGVGLTSAFVSLHFGVPAAPFLRFIEDRDLWRFKFELTPAVFSAVTSRPQTRAAWDAMENMNISMLVAEGTAIERYRTELIESVVSTAFQIEMFGRSVWCVSCPYAIGSDVAGELAKRDPEGFAAYFVDYGDRLKYGLRSADTGMDVAALAQQYGGGGHKHAAGFEIKTLPRNLKD